MREPERDWPRAYAQPWRVRLADRAASDAGLPPGSEGYVRAKLAPRGPYLVEVAGDEADLGGPARRLVTVRGAALTRLLRDPPG